jgi:hypothetical protein
MAYKMGLKNWYYSASAMGTKYYIDNDEHRLGSWQNSKINYNFSLLFLMEIATCGEAGAVAHKTPFK